MKPSKVRDWLVHLCWECLYIVGIIATYSILAVANPVSLNAELHDLINNHLWAVLALSLLGGAVGLLSRLQNPKYRAKATASGLLFTIVSELSFSVFSGLLLLYVGVHQAWDSYMIVISILVGSWLGTKAARILWLWIRSKVSIGGGNAQV